LAWRAVSSDGHPSRSSFTFIVLAAAAAATESLPAPTTRGSAIQSADTGISFGAGEEQANGSESASSSLARSFSFGGILIVIGVIVFNLLVVARSDRIGSELVWRMESRAAVVGFAASILVIIAGFTRIYLESRMMNEMPGMQAMSMTEMVMHTRWGFALRLEIIAAFLALISFAIAIPRVRGAWLTASLCAAVLGFTPALAGHAGASPRFTALMIATDFLHVLGASSWLGNLACVMLIGVPIVLRNAGEERWQSVATLVNAFSPVALASATVVVLSGTIASWVHLDRLSDLWTTTYGQMLFRKLILVALTLAIGGYNFRMVQPRLLQEGGTARIRRWAALELSLGVIIILITGFLTGISP
jgi:copper transport protein